ncbi:glycosyltransferase [Desulfococcaceae bacterium HSG7]|nr:glycosyltransferase [Desulfococcaceae bacterium HSG7]
MHIVYWGTYDTGKPRNRILLRGLRENKIEITECHANIWEGVEDKSQIAGRKNKFQFILKWIWSYPGLILRYLKLPRHDVVFVGYMGHLDVLVLWFFAKIRNIPIVWDAFLSLYDTVIQDRQMVCPRHPLAKLLYCWEWLACRAADLVILDTNAHADYFRRHFKLAYNRVGVAFVGAETDIFPPSSPKLIERDRQDNSNALSVLFYGQFIPLHGIETIIEAAIRLRKEPIRWIIIGQGQESLKISNMLAKHSLPQLTWLPWADYEKLAAYIHHADICLGIFGNSGKANRVIPNKVFHILAAGKPLITRDSTAIRELLHDDMPGIFLVPPAAPQALANKIKYLSRKMAFSKERLHQKLTYRIRPVAVAGMLLDQITKMSKL